jgi:hypothetical protein
VAGVDRERFLPSRHGFAFANDWPPGPAVVFATPLGRLGIGDVGAGLCGGMVFAALDYWHAGVLPPAARPARGEPLYRHVVRRLVHSWRLPVGVARYYRWMLRSDPAVVRRTVDRQWPRIAADLDRGVPVALGVVTAASARPGHLVRNHQVLAYGYDVSGDGVILRVYDPNRGPRDDVSIRFRTDAGARARGFAHNLDLDAPVRGFFRVPHRPAVPPPPSCLDDGVDGGSGG